MIIDYTCQNEECEREFEIRFTPATPDENMSGCFEDAEQGSPAECSPSECPECGKEVDIDIVERDAEE